MWKFFAMFSAFSGFLAVGFGAFGAHALKERLTAADLAIWQTANQYQFYHTLALLLVLLFWLRFPAVAQWGWAAAGFTTGIVIFSGSLYILSLSGIRWLGAITPIGGIFFLIAWLFLMIAMFKISV